MENNQQMQNILSSLEKHTRRQLLFTKILCALCAAVVIISLVLMLAVTGAVSQITQLTEPLQEVSAQVQDMAVQAETVMDNLGTVTQALADADLGSMVENVNILTADSQTAVTEAMEKLDTIDINTLNKAIQDLADVVEPLAKFSNIFG